ncbi:CaiB/BaiF CoA transferase family protein [Pontivivens nitratireducens]|uniref:CaiB/BaiF CoA transferase family protein n=1 Tax=Pontivivens nitratireducens TaxID=2758038 RepID=UPI001C8D9FEB|nr:CoA transferase [Pontibrevibacter nitratireducens]
MTEQDKRPMYDFPVHPGNNTQNKGPLAGLRVIDFTHFIAGPFATMMLADLGAEVIKIESPKGEDFRQFPPADPALEGQGSPYLWANRNKKGVALNLKTEDGLGVARDLIATADVLVENFSSGVMERFGLGYEDLKSAHPDLIYTSISAYGRTGPDADRLGFDTVVQAESGFMSFNGFPDREGIRVQPVIMDSATAMMAANGILAALMRRERVGGGQRVDVSLYDTSMIMIGYGSMQYLMNGSEPTRIGNSSNDTAPTGVFNTQDSAFFVSSSNTAIFQRIFRLIGRDDIADDPALQNRMERLKRREWMKDILSEAFEKKPWSHWAPLLRKAGVPAGEMRTMAAALHSEETKSAGLVTRIPHATAGYVPNIALPIRLSDSPTVDPVAAPRIGEHTQQVLESLGYDSDRLERLSQGGAVAGVAPEKTT